MVLWRELLVLSLLPWPNNKLVLRVLNHLACSPEVNKTASLLNYSRGTSKMARVRCGQTPWFQKFVKGELFAVNSVTFLRVQQKWAGGQRN
jgi:hypothetical protein